MFKDLRSSLFWMSIESIVRAISVFAVTLLGFVKPSVVLAQEPPDLPDDLIEIMFERLVKLSFPIAIIVATIMIIIGGYMWMISAGDPQKLKSAQGTLTWGIIGLIFLGLLGLIIEVVFDIFL